MVVRSDVALVMKPFMANAFVLKFPELAAMAEREFKVNKSIEDDGSLFIFNDINWYEFGSPIKDLYDWLKSNSSGNYLVVVACSENPEDTTADCGEWYDNPWNVKKYIRVSLEFDETVDCDRIK